MTPKQQRFVEEYLVDLNASAAARRAGYSERTAFRSGQECMQKPAIVAAIAAKRAALSEQTGLTVSRVMADIAKVKADAMQLVTDPETGVQSMLSHKDALKALELEGKHLGAFTDRMQVSGANGGPLLVQRIEIHALTPDDKP